MRARTCAIGTVLFFLAAGCMSPAQPYNQRGVALYNTGQYVAAQAEFMQATAQDPLNADAFYNLGSSHHRAGQRAEADWNYVRCLNLDQNHSKCHHARAVLLLEQDRGEEAYESAQQWAKNSPASPEPLVELAWIEKQTGRTQHARELLQQAIAMQPRHPRALTELASLYESSNDPDRALVLYERALACAPDQSELERKVADLRGATSEGSSDRERSQNRRVNTPNSRPIARDLRYEYR